MLRTHLPLRVLVQILIRVVLKGYNILFTLLLVSRGLLFHSGSDVQDLTQQFGLLRVDGVLLGELDLEVDVEVAVGHRVFVEGHADVLDSLSLF